MHAPETFRTGRLLAERLGIEHLPELLRMHRDPAVMATLGGVRSEAETRDLIDRNGAHWEAHGFGLWAVRTPAGGAFVGRAGLRHVEVVGKDEVEVAYALGADWWGRGLATELARALVEIAARPLGLLDVVGFTLPTNHASRRVLAKAGFLFEREIIHAGLPHVLYRRPGEGPAGMDAGPGRPTIRG